MRIKNLFPIISIITLFLSLISCDVDKEEQLVPIHSLHYFLYDENSKAILEDTCVNASSQEIRLKVKTYSPIAGYVQCNREWDVFTNTMEKDKDWFNVKVIEDGDDVCLLIRVEENNSGKERCFEITVVHEIQMNQIHWGRMTILQKAMSNAGSFNIQAKYKNKLYETVAHLNENDEIVYENPEFQGLISLLSKKRNVETFVLSESEITFYDEEDFENSYNLQKIREKIRLKPYDLENNRFEIKTRYNGFEYESSNYLGYCALFKNSSFGGDFIYKNLYDPYESWDISEMATVNLNDAISSVAIEYDGPFNIVAVLTVWQYDNFNYGDSDYSYHRMSFIASYGYSRLTWPNLNTIPMINSNYSWNDRISAISFHFAQIGQSYPNH